VNGLFSPITMLNLTARITGRHPGSLLSEISVFADDLKVALESYDSGGELKAVVGRVPDGEVKLLCDDGTLLALLNYSGGKRNGMTSNFDEKGQLRREVSYGNGLLEGPARLFYDFGELLSESSYKSGREDGVCRVYYRSGRILSETPMSDGHANGIGRCFTEDGQLAREAVFVRGVCRRLQVYSPEYLGDFPNGISAELPKSYARLAIISMFVLLVLVAVHFRQAYVHTAGDNWDIPFYNFCVLTANVIMYVDLLALSSGNQRHNKFRSVSFAGLLTQLLVSLLVLAAALLGRLSGLSLSSVMILLFLPTAAFLCVFLPPLLIRFRLMAEESRMRVRIVP